MCPVMHMWAVRVIKPYTASCAIVVRSGRIILIWVSLRRTTDADANAKDDLRIIRLARLRSTPRQERRSRATIVSVALVMDRTTLQNASALENTWNAIASRAVQPSGVFVGDRITQHREVTILVLHGQPRLRSSSPLAIPGRFRGHHTHSA
jgi:hypothetical protein